MNRDPDLSIKKYFILIILTGTVFRLWGIWHGYPYSYYPDEAHFVKRALAFGSGDLNPHWFHKPAFFMYLLFFEYGVLFIIGKLIGFWDAVRDFAVFYICNPGPFYIIGRVTVSLFSIGMIGVIYLTAKRMANRSVALIASLILCFSFGHVMVAKNVKADVPCAFFTLVSIYYIVAYFKEKKHKYLFFSAIFAGIGTATKTYSIVMLVPLLIALAGDIKSLKSDLISQKIKIFCFCLAFFWISYFICAPYNFMDPLGRKATFGPIKSLMNKVETFISGEKKCTSPETEKLSKTIHNPGLSLSVYLSGIKSYIKVLGKGMGWVILFLAFSGFLYVIIKDLTLLNMCFLFFPLLFIFIAIFLYPGYSEIRHQVVIYPFLIVLAAIGTEKIIKRFSFSDKAIVLLMIGILAVPFYNIVQHNILISRQDTRNIAKTWFETHIPPGTKILLDENSVPLMQNEKKLEQMLAIAKKSDPGGQFTAHYYRYLEYQLLAAKNSITYDIEEIRFPWWRDSEVKKGIHKLDSEFDKDMGNPLRPVGVESYEYYVKHGFKYAVTHSNRYNSFINNTPRSVKFPSFTKFYRELFKRAKLIKEFIPSEKIKRPGPVIKIFELNF